MTKKSVISVILMISLTIVGAFADMHHFKPVNVYHHTFNDVSEEDWYFESVKNAYEFSLFNGKGDATFDPDGNLTWAQAVKLSATINAIYTEGDTKIIGESDGDVWYAPYADYLKDVGILGAQNIDYDSAINRIDFANLFANTLPDDALNPINRIDDAIIPDVNYDKDINKNVYKLYRAGILTGSDKKGTFLPKTQIRRSEVAAIVMRMVDENLRQHITLIKSFQSGNYKPYVYPYINKMYVGEKAYIVLNDYDNKVGNVKLENTDQNQEIAKLTIGKWHEYGDNILAINAIAHHEGTAEYILSTQDANGNALHEELILIEVLPKAIMLDNYKSPDFEAMYTPYITYQNETDNQYVLVFQPLSFGDDDYKINAMFSYQQMLMDKDFKRDDDNSTSELQIYKKTVFGTEYSVTIDYTKEDNNQVTITYAHN